MVLLASLGLWDDSNLFCTSAAKPVCCTVMLPCPGCWGWSSNPMESAILSSSAKGPKPGSRSCLGQYLEHPTGLSHPLGYQMKAAPFRPSLRWFLSWLSLWLCIVGWSDPVWQGVIRMCCFTSAAQCNDPSAQFWVSVISWLSGGRAAMWGLPAPLLAHRAQDSCQPCSSNLNQDNLGAAEPSEPKPHKFRSWAQIIFANTLFFP